MKYFLLSLFISGQLLSQVVFNPTSTIVCNALTSSVQFSIGSGSPPFTYTVESPCGPTFTTSYQYNFTKSITLDCPGIFTITVKDASNTVNSTVTHTVSKATHWDVPIISSVPFDTICPLTILTLYIQDTSNLSTSFTFAPVNWSSGQNTKTIFPTQSVTTTYSVSGIFTASRLMNVALTKTCTISNSITVIVANRIDGIDCPVGIEESDIFSSFLLFPNPNNGVLKIKYDKAILHLTDIRIKNYLGQLVKLCDPNDNEFDISTVSRGIYFVTISADNARKTFKIVKD